MAVNYGVSPTWARTTNEGRTYIARTGLYSNNVVFNIDFGSNSCYSGTGTSVTDLTNSYTGTLTSGAVYSANDRYGSIVHDGVDDYIDFGSVGVSSNVSVTNNFTIEQVFMPTAYQPGSYFGLTNLLAFKQSGAGSTMNYCTQATSDTSVTFIKRSSAESLQYHTFTVPSMVNKPTHLAFVITNGTSGSGSVACYHNGTLIGSNTITGSAIAAGSGDTLRIGNIGISNSCFTGSYYTCRIYSESLSAASVQRNFNIIKGRFGI